MKRMGTLLSVLVMVIGLSVSAHAALVDMHDGTIYDTATQLSWLKNAHTVGTQMNWSSAIAWAASLNNSGGFAGLTGWRLPNADPTCNGGGAGYNCTGSEMGYLYYVSLGNAAGGPLTNAGPFTNVQAVAYWSGTVSATDPTYALSFDFTNGDQYTVPQSVNYYGWAVRPGARSVSSATPVGYSPQWLLITLVSLLIVGGYLFRRRMAG